MAIFGGGAKNLGKPCAGFSYKAVIPDLYWYGGQMLFGKYDFFSRFTGDSVLPIYKGSTLRGAFGTALRNLTCVLKSHSCCGCPVLNSCVYQRIFENASTGLVSQSGIQPHPFVLEPPLTTTQRFVTGDEFNFSVLLFGFANESLPYFVLAFEQAGKAGMGKFLQGQRSGFKLERVLSQSGAVFDYRDRKIHPSLHVDMPFIQCLKPDDERLVLTIRIETPLRIKFRNHYSAELPFDLFARSMLRRISSLNECFGRGEPELDYRGLIGRASSVKTLKSSLSWLDWTRYSNRQQLRMQLGGIVGEVTYEGALKEFLPLIKYSEIVHLGKATTFGLGKIKCFRRS